MFDDEHRSIRLEFQRRTPEAKMNIRQEAQLARF
jgi:hypothetical protein